LPGGGGTPLAAALASALALANQAQRRGVTPTLVVLSDGRANVARDGAPGRDAALADALRAARQVRAARIASLFIDTAARPSMPAQQLASAMSGRYIALPFATARALNALITDAVKR
jgi:magnesium chelatase subunit D